MESESKAVTKTITTNTFTTNLTTNPYIPPIKPGIWKQWDDEWEKGLIPITPSIPSELLVPKNSWLVSNAITTPRIILGIKIKKVIFNPPATVVYWEDGEKTVVKCTEGELFNESAGVALCFMKRFCKDYKPTLKKAVKNAERPFKKAEDAVKANVDPTKFKFSDAFKNMADAFEKFVDKEIKKYGTNENNNDKGNK